MRIINEIIVHCSDTPEGRNDKAEDIRRWHVNGNGWSDIGYHYVVDLDGTTCDRAQCQLDWRVLRRRARCANGLRERYAHGCAEGEPAGIAATFACEVSRGADYRSLQCVE